MWQHRDKNRVVIGGSRRLRMNARSVLQALLDVMPEDAELGGFDMHFAVSGAVAWPWEELTQAEKDAADLRSAQKRHPGVIPLSSLEPFADLLAEYDRKIRSNSESMDRLHEEDEKFNDLLQRAVDHHAVYAPTVEEAEKAANAG